MPYRLRTGESVQDGIRRVLSKQIERSLGELADTNLNRADTIHQVRKRCKKIRAARSPNILSTKLIQGSYRPSAVCWRQARVR